MVRWVLYSLAGTMSHGAQAHKFLTGFAPIRAAVRLGAAAGALLAIPAEQLRRDGAAPRAGAAPLSRQIQRGLTGAPPLPAYADLRESRTW